MATSKPAGSGTWYFAATAVAMLAYTMISSERGPAGTGAVDDPTVKLAARHQPDVRSGSDRHAGTDWNTGAATVALALDATANPVAVATNDDRDDSPDAVLTAAALDAALASDAEYVADDEADLPAEDTDPAVLAELAGLNPQDPALAEQEAPPVTSETADLPPTGAYAEQVLVGDVQPSAYETKIYGFDLPPPDTDNLAATGVDVYADQIDPQVLHANAVRSGVLAARDDDVLPAEVDPSTDPPVETGAGIQP